MGTRIEQVEALMVTIEGLSNPMRYGRETVLKSINKDNKWYTCLLKEKRGARNIWERGAEIHVVEVDDEKFIRIDGNKMKADNLGELPSL
jgi:sulfur transfer complex TusBCD TusB component (DsrH family)